MGKQLAALAALVGACMLAAGCTNVVDGTAVAADKSGPLHQDPIPVSALEGLPLDLSQINAALGATSMKVWFNAKAMWDWSKSVADKNCLAIDGPAQEKVYAGTGWTAMRGQRLDDSINDSKKRDHYNGMLSSSQVQEGGDGWTCQRALTARNNVTIDIVTCAYSQPDLVAIGIANQIAAKVAKQ